MLTALPAKNDRKAIVVDNLLRRLNKSTRRMLAVGTCRNAENNERLDTVGPLANSPDCTHETKTIILRLDSFEHREIDLQESIRSASVRRNRDVFTRRTVHAALLQKGPGTWHRSSSNSSSEQTGRVKNP